MSLAQTMANVHHVRLEHGDLVPLQVAVTADPVGEVLEDFRNVGGQASRLRHAGRLLGRQRLSPSRTDDAQARCD